MVWGRRVLGVLEWVTNDDSGWKGKDFAFYPPPPPGPWGQVSTPTMAALSGLRGLGASPGSGVRHPLNLTDYNGAQQLCPRMHEMQAVTQNARLHIHWTTGADVTAAISRVK